MTVSTKTIAAEGPAALSETGEMETTLRGVGVSHGVAIGEVRHMGTAGFEPPAQQNPSGGAGRGQGGGPKTGEGGGGPPVSRREMGGGGSPRGLPGPGPDG